MTIHTFSESLAKSNEYAEAEWWETVYRRAFHNLAGMTSVRHDGWAQRCGIDRVLTLTSGKTLTVDEKVRFKEYGDIALEYWSDRDRRVPGWVAKDLACDYIAYAFVSSQRCFLLPFPQLRRAWRTHHASWVEKYKPPIEADNGNYVTICVGVPIDELLSKISDASVVSWA